MENNNNQPPIYPETGKPEVENELAKVSSSPKYWIIFATAIAIAIAIYFVIASFLKNNSSPDTSPITNAPVALPKQNLDYQNVIPQLPEPPKLIEPTAPPPPPPPEPVKEVKLPPTPEPAAALPKNNNIAVPGETSAILPVALPDKTLAEAEQKRRDAKRRSSMILIAGKTEKEIIVTTDPELKTLLKGLENESFHLMLAKGKIIDAILETSVNSSIGGTTKAIISRDVYAEYGNAILIPKGSKALGTYATGTGTPLGRLSVTWERILLPTGYLLDLKGAVSVDNLGRQGIQGRVDLKIKEQITNVAISGALNIAIGKGVDKLVPPVASQTVTASGVNNAAIVAAATNLFSQLGTTPATAIPQICASAISTAGSDVPTATQITAWCATAQTAPVTTAKLATLMQSLQSLSSSTTNAGAVVTNTTSQAQSASQTAFTDFGSTLTNINSNNTFKTEVTIDQGTPIKIYLSSDVFFPKAAVLPKRLMP